MDRVRIVDKRLFSWKDVDKVLKGVLLQHMRVFFATIGTVNGVSVAMEPDFALRVFQQQIDNFYGYRHKAGQIERSLKT